jgi:hypothetical protein
MSGYVFYQNAPKLPSLGGWAPTPNALLDMSVYGEKSPEHRHHHIERDVRMYYV